MPGDSQRAPNVFLAWSGERSGAVARALHEWLPTVIQQCVPWMSQQDIYAGKRWRSEVTQHLDSLKFGVLCLTKENILAPWINFEAGALSRSVDNDRLVVPYCFGLKPTDYGDPLGDFQGVEADRRGTRELVRSINNAMTDPLDERVSETVFDRAFPSLEAELNKIPKTAPVQAPPRMTPEMVEEILLLVRGLRSDVANLQFPARTAKNPPVWIPEDHSPPKGARTQFFGAPRPPRIEMPGPPSKVVETRESAGEKAAKMDEETAASLRVLLGEGESQ